MTVPVGDGTFAAGGDRPPALEQRFAVAQAMAERAGELVRQSFRGAIEATIKERSSTVTNVDHESEELLRAVIRERFPGDSIVGEEFGLELDDPDWVWTLDPIDGTQNFVAGVPLVSVVVGLLHRGSPVLAVIHDPLGGETYAAMRGAGATRNGKALHVDSGPLTALSLFAVRHRFLRGPRAGLLETLPTTKLRCLGSVCLEMAYVAAGGFAGMLAGSVRLWEVAPGALLIAEAGGVACEAGGSQLFPLREPIEVVTEARFRMLAGGRPVVDEVLRELAALGL